MFLIITAGNIDDMEYVEEFISRNSSSAPASVMVVNIGKENEEKRSSLGLKTNFE